LNSVFEDGRALILSEKSSSEAIKIVATGDFNIVATMNPSGDFGKKELSPALRNRMTEIWVESYFLQDTFMDLYSHKEPKIHTSISNNIDLWLISSKMAENQLKGLQTSEIEKISTVLFNMIGFVNFTLARKYTVLQRKALSIRDVINAVDFVKVSHGLFDKETANAQAVYHAVELVIMDGLCLGIDVAGMK
jgi:midasin (ATPase involved in ribosome maturation)